MKLKEALDEKHAQKPAHQPPDRQINRTQVLPTMRQEVKKANSEHEPSDKAGRHLHSGVSQPNEDWQPTARQ